MGSHVQEWYLMNNHKSFKITMKRELVPSTIGLLSCAAVYFRTDTIPAVLESWAYVVLPWEPPVLQKILLTTVVGHTW